MQVLSLPNNIKVHFAACEVQNQYEALRLGGVRYTLYTAFPFVERMVFDKPLSPVMPLSWQKNPNRDIPHWVMQNSLHTIQDSGLFTLMFGSRKGKKDEVLMNKWYDALIRFTNDNAQGVTCVEVDCQKVLGVKQAWEFRERMAKDCPTNRLINVFHLEDGQKGLDRLIEYSNYIAISVPELRGAGKRDYTYSLAKYIKSKKPSIDVHLLGCTEVNLLKKCNFCTSCDSTSYVAGKRFGYLTSRHISRIKTKEVQQLVGLPMWEGVFQYNNETNTNFLCLSVEKHKREYERAGGRQDYLPLKR